MTKFFKVKYRLELDKEQAKKTLESCAEQYVQHPQDQSYINQLYNAAIDYVATLSAKEKRESLIARGGLTCISDYTEEEWEEE